MIDKISARDLEAIKGEGAKVTRKVTKASPAPPDEINKSLGRLTEAVMVAGKTEKVIALASERHLANIANSLGDGAKSLLDQLTQKAGQPGLDRAYRGPSDHHQEGIIDLT
jgi:hypothetical protein